jgi:hypothetical protein
MDSGESLPAAEAGVLGTVPAVDGRRDSHVAESCRCSVLSMGLPVVALSSCHMEPAEQSGRPCVEAVDEREASYCNFTTPQSIRFNEGCDAKFGRLMRDARITRTVGGREAPVRGRWCCGSGSGDGERPVMRDGRWWCCCVCARVPPRLSSVKLQNR